jgi:putative protease
MEERIGIVGHFFSNVGVAAVKLEAPLKRGEKVHVKGHTTDFVCTVASLQIDRKDVAVAKAGDDVGFPVPERVREHDEVFRVHG